MCFSFMHASMALVYVGVCVFIHMCEKKNGIKTWKKIWFEKTEMVQNRVGEKDRRKGGVKIGKTVSGFRLELTGWERMIGTHGEKDWEEITNLACLGAFTHNQSAVCGNIGGIVIDIQDLDCDWYIAHQIWIVWKKILQIFNHGVFQLNNWQKDNEWSMYEGFHMIEIMPYQDTLA